MPSRPVFVASYAAVVLLSVIDAAGWKFKEVDTEGELAWTLFATALTVVLAHWFAESLAIWVDAHHKLTLRRWLELFVELSMFFVVLGAPCAAMALTAIFGLPFETAISAAQLALVVILAAAGAAGARAAGDSTGRIIAAGLVSAVIGVIISALKFVLGAD